MVEPTPIVLTLEIEGRSEPIRGRLSDPSGLAVVFTGWVGLAAAIERAAHLDGHPPPRGGAGV